MKILLISILSLACVPLDTGVRAEKKSSEIDHLKIVNLSVEDPESSQRKSDSGYSYDRPVRLSSSQRHELIRARILTKRPNGQTLRPFDHYGPPNYRHQPGVQRHRHQQQEVNILVNDFTSGPSNGHTQQSVPSPIKDYEFIEPSPIAGQNSIPFNSNAANYLPPRNQKLPHLHPFGFAKQQQSSYHKIGLTGHENRQQLSSSNNQPSQSLRQESLNDHQQISDAAIFLAQNSQSISQLYEAPATNLNYEPIHESDGFNQLSKNPNNAFQTHQESSGFRGNLPSYASGFLNSQDASIRDVQSLEKDRLIVQLQRALSDVRTKADFPSTTTIASVRYAQNNENPNNPQTHSQHGYQGQMNPSIGPQLDRPNNFNSRRPYGTTITGFTSLVPSTTSTLPEYTYGPPSTTPANRQQTSTTIPTSTTISSATDRPLEVTATGESSSQMATSIAPVSTTSTTFRVPQYGGFVPSFIGTSFLANYPTYSTNFLTTGSSTINQIETSSPTHFGIPIPTLTATQGTTTVPASPEFFGNPDASSGQALQPIQPIHSIHPIHPISSSTVRQGFPLVSAATQIQPVQTALTTSTSSHPAYDVQPSVANPILEKAIKTVYPVYYYPNVYQIQKSATSTIPWSYAPSHLQTGQARIWK